MTEDSLIDLGNVITGHDIVSELTHEEMYYYPTKQYCPIDQNSLFKNNVSKEEKTKNLTCHPSYIQNKTWHVYSKKLQGGLCKVCVLFYQNWDRNLEVNLLDLYLKMLVSRTK